MKLTARQACEAMPSHVPSVCSAEQQALVSQCEEVILLHAQADEQHAKLILPRNDALLLRRLCQQNGFQVVLKRMHQQVNGVVLYKVFIGWE